MSRDWAHSIVVTEIPNTTAEPVKETFREAGDEEQDLASEKTSTAGQHAVKSKPATTGQHAAGEKPAATGQHAASGKPASTERNAANGKPVDSEQHAANEKPATVRPRAENGAGKAQATSGAAVQTADEESVRSVADSLAAKSDSLSLAADPAYSYEAEAFHYSELDSVRFGWSSSGTPRPNSAQLPGRDTTVEALFGAQSCIVQTERIERPVSDSFTDNAVFQSFVLLLAATYATLLYRNLGDVRTLLKRISRDSAAGERLSEEPGANGFSRFLNVTAAIGMLFMGVIVVKYGDTLMPPEFGRALSHAAVLALSLTASLLWAVIILFQSSIIRITGAITLTQPFTAQLSLLRRTYFALAVIVTSPTLLLFALCPRGTGGAWFILGAVELIITAVLYLRESLNLFISKKISILHWFLYLCTVEVFPISLLWLLAAR